MKLEDVKLIACDMDGTLLNDHKVLTRLTLQTLGSLKKKGIHLCLASGRHESFLHLNVKQLDCCPILISCNGAVTRRFQRSPKDKREGSFHEEYTTDFCQKVMLSKEESQSTVDFFASRNRPFVAYTEDMMYYSSNSTEILEMMTSHEDHAQRQGYLIRLPKRPFRSVEELPVENLIKLAGYKLDQEDEEALFHWTATTKHLMAEKAGKNATAVLSKRATKGMALEEISNHLGILPEEIAVFGDEVNDLSLFEYAKYSFAMERSVEGLKHKAWKVIGDNNEDAVARAIQKYFLL